VSTTTPQSESPTGVVVYPIGEPQESKGFVQRGGTTAYSVAAEAEPTLSQGWTTAIAIVTSLLMLGIGWLLVSYWNMLT
jgi:hypothetical protein